MKRQHNQVPRHKNESKLRTCICIIPPLVHFAFPPVFSSHGHGVSCGLGNEREGGKEGTTNMADEEERRRLVERSRSKS